MVTTLRISCSLWQLLIVGITVLLLQAEAKSLDVTQMSVSQIEDAVQQCSVVKNLNHHRRGLNVPSSGISSQIFSFLFPGTPAVNALLATLYISGPPNFLLALCPSNIDPSSLSVMVAFAVGGLLGDTIFHLLPEIFLGEALVDRVRFVLVEPNKNLLLGIAILVGFVTFVAMDKGLRIATGGEGGHDHGHGSKRITLEEEEDETASVNTSYATTTSATPVASNGDVRFRNGPSPQSTSYSKIPDITRELRDGLALLDEPARSDFWLKAVLEEDSDCDISQRPLWTAYVTQLTGSKAPLLSPADLIVRLCQIFDGASPQSVRVKTTTDVETKYIFKGVRPRAIALTRDEITENLSPSQQKYTAMSPSPSSKHASPYPESTTPSSPSIRLSAYLNLIADFTHNITDGLAIASSFYASPTLGATTTVAVFFHEIPHEVGDFALLIQYGFSKKRAMAAQFVTALGAFLGTFLGIAVQELGKLGGDGSSPAAGKDGNGFRGLMGTGLGFGDLLLPFTAGTFLYVGTVAVIPELLETGRDRKAEVRKTLLQFAAMATGAGIMLAISWA